MKQYVIIVTRQDGTENIIKTINRDIANVIVQSADALGHRYKFIVVDE